jgi:hypothetical protein
VRGITPLAREQNLPRNFPPAPRRPTAKSPPPRGRRRNSGDERALRHPSDPSLLYSTYRRRRRRRRMCQTLAVAPMPGTPPPPPEPSSSRRARCCTQVPPLCKSPARRGHQPRGRCPRPSARRPWQVPIIRSRRRGRCPLLGACNNLCRRRHQAIIQRHRYSPTLRAHT